MKSLAANFGVFERTRAALLLFVVLTSVALMAQTWWAVQQDKAQTIASETANELVAVRLLEEHANQTLQDAVHTLDQVARAVQLSAGTRQLAPAQVRKVVTTHDLSAGRHLKALQYVGLDGMSWISSPDYPTHQNSTVDREELQFLIQNPDYRGPTVGKPYASPYDSQWVIPVARMLYDINQQPLGVISVDIRLSYFGALYARVAKENDASVALLSDDGFIIVRSPFEARYANRDVSEEVAMAHLRTARDEGSFTDTAFLDDDEGLKLYTFRKIAGFPISAVYARNFDTLMSPWESRTKDRILFAGVMLVLTLLLTSFLLIYIHRLKRSQSSLLESEGRFVSLFKFSSVASALVGPESGQFEEVNNAWLDQFGYQRDEVVGHTALELGLWADPHRRDELMARLDKFQVIDRYEVRHRHKDGHDIDCIMSGRIFHVGTQMMVVFTLIDVTRQRQAEQEIRDMNLQLEQRVKARTAKLEISNRDLENALTSVQAMQGELLRSEKMAALGSLVAGVAHELNTPIGNSVTVSSTLQHQLTALATQFRDGTMKRSGLAHFIDNATEGVEILMRSLLRASQLIGSFKRVAVDQSSDLRRAFDLCTVLREVCWTLEPMYKNTPYSLTLDLPGAIPMDSFPGALGQIITNFVSNSLQHGFEGCPTGRMRLQASMTEPGHVQIVFSDNGIGMNEDTQNRVFDPFFTTKLGQGGSGLGMNIVYNIIHDVLGGTVDVDTAPGQGVRITVNIPTTARNQAALT
jgi:PAS domain S-box-containing protein